MQYFGGKHRISRDLATFIQPCVTGDYIEPFCGACWVGLRIEARLKIFSDINPDLILMYQELQRGWVPPTLVSEERYKELKEMEPGTSPERAFAGFGCSFAGKFFGGYARCKRGDDYAANARNSLLRDYAANARNITFICSDYTDLKYPDGAVVYCDPPYIGTTKYFGTPPFDYDKFWEWCRMLSGRCIVFISEYEAPSDFSAIWTKETKTEIRTKNGRESRIEKLFWYTPNGSA